MTDARAPALALAAALALALMAPGAGAQQAPLSASDWLSGSVQVPLSGLAVRPGDATAARARQVAASGAVGAVSVRRLDGVNPDHAGVIAPEAAGLPADLWADSDGARLATLVAALPVRLPAMAGLGRRVILAQLDAPPGAARGALFLARVDRLLDLGDLDGAQALLAAAGPGDAQHFRRDFDVALLQGDEAAACARMDRATGIAPSFAARIFCLAQGGDWPAAALVYRGAVDLGLVGPEQAPLLAHFLDDAYADSGDLLTPPNPVTPLDFRMFGAIGQPLPTGDLPIAFAWSDLGPQNGWKARLEAGERLARAGAIVPARLLALYLEQRPAASGGVWDRAAALQRVIVALDGGAGEDAGPALVAAHDAFAAQAMMPVLAAMLESRLADLPAGVVNGPAAAQVAVLRGWRGQAAVPGTLAPTPTPAPATRKGEALLAAIYDIDAGIEGDATRAARGLGLLAAMGLGEDAAQAAAQLALMGLR